MLYSIMAKQILIKELLISHNLVFLPTLLFPSFTYSRPYKENGKNLRSFSYSGHIKRDWIKNTVLGKLFFIKSKNMNVINLMYFVFSHVIFFKFNFRHIFYQFLRKWEHAACDENQVYSDESLENDFVLGI